MEQLICRVARLKYYCCRYTYCYLIMVTVGREFAFTNTEKNVLQILRVQKILRTPCFYIMCNVYIILSIAIREKLSETLLGIHQYWLEKSFILDDNSLKIIREPARRYMCCETHKSSVGLSYFPKRGGLPCSYGSTCLKLIFIRGAVCLPIS